MYFKKIELQGFKSFANRTVIEFEPGVTAIVGPNGCGKSNISDAIRWVLGEQSAKSLRGGSMEDVIFNGSASKEAVNFAEVSLTLSNESKILPVDYDEVTISRRLFRSGESEYLLNKNPVRLKDITELLLGTGIGTESYSIVEQGKMDMILNSKPEDRRMIFEEAAGITKFKAQKKEALRKLEQTDANLLRINDIIVEVKRQIGSIERQAKKAEAYKNEFAKLKDLELRVARNEFILFDARRKEKEDELHSLKAQEQEFLAVVEEIHGRCVQKRNQAAALDQSLKDGQTEEMRLSGEIRKNQDRALLNRERIGELLERKTNLDHQIEAAERRLEEFARELENLSAEFERLRRDEEEGAAFLATVENDFKTIEAFLGESASKEEGLRSALSVKAEQKNAFQAELFSISAQASALDPRIGKLSDEEVAAHGRLSETEARRQSLQAETAAAEKSLAERLENQRIRETSLTECNRRIVDLQKTLVDLGQRESALQSKVEFLKDQIERHEGFWGGVKALVEDRNTRPEQWTGWVGPLAGLIESEKGHEGAVEAALDTFLQSVVFETDADLLRAAAFLRQGSHGRAMLVSLESAVPAQSPTLLPSASILDRIHAEPRIKSLLASLIGNSASASNAEEALKLAKSHPGLVFITSEGERFEGRAVLGGVAERSDASLLGREAKIRGYQDEYAQTLLQSEQARQELLNQEQLRQKLEGDAKSESDQVIKAQIDIGHLNERLKQIDELKGSESRRAEQIAAERGSLESQKSAFLSRVEELNALKAAIDSDEKTLTETLNGVLEAVKNRAGERENLLVRLAETRSRQATRTGEREKIEKDRNWIHESKNNQEEFLTSFRKEIQEAGTKKEALEVENVAIEEELARLAADRDELLKRLEGVRLERDEAADELIRLEAEWSSKRQFLEEAREKTHALEMDNAQVIFAIDRLKERILNAYQIDLLVQNEMMETERAAQREMGLPEPDPEPELNLEEAKAEIQKQKDKLSKMGPVNLVAIEEHDEMKQRFEFLTQQHTDLTHAKEDLHKAILKINRTTRELFVDTFAKIQKYFSEYYRILFGGGSAELVLMDEADVLETGIEIIARPPGKKLQTIGLLSGGEKALTAVALVFALFKVKPSPFCILDEIDAPLDEANVERFCTMLREFCKESQFIVITHNKRTMNLADALYGITMAENGISRVVSVRLSEGRIEHPRKDAAEEALV